MALTKENRRLRIRRRIRKTISGSAARPRLTVFRSNKQINVQLIDDVEGKTLVGVSSGKLKKAQGVPKLQQAEIVGKEIAELASKAGINEVVFDRSGYLYHGRIKALAEAAREGGLKF